MNTIYEYVDKMFKNVVKTEETEQLKIDITANMEDRYYALIEEGASENEAIGTVIVEFGNIEEVLDEMELNQRPNVENDLDGVMVVEMDHAHEYIEVRRKSGLGIGLGVLSCMIGLGGLVSMIGLFLSELGVFIGLVFFFLFGVIGVSLFIINGMRLTNYKQYNSPFILVPEAKESVLEMMESYRKSHTTSIVLGIALCVFSLIPVIFGAMTEYEKVILLGAGVMFALVGVGILLFVYTGMNWTTYQNLLSKGKTVEQMTSSKKFYQQQTKVEYVLSDIYWPAIVVLYLTISFIFGLWSWSWIIFVVGGILEDTIKRMYDLKK